ncbi:MAG: hypothetical protein GY847_08510 [Proteobacteria bacterium]|nr:hypothetical protein [Pseudomonadota bacterium]
MAISPWNRKALRNIDVQGLAIDLACRLAPMKPDVVLYLEKGGRAVGLTVAGELKVPAIGLDISYPLSRLLNKAPPVAQIAAWPVKEIIYRLASPRLNKPLAELANVGKVALVDDSASSGRSLKVAFNALRAAGICRCDIRVAVIRCGPRARSIVDHFEVTQPVLFVGR